jgi:hypothetical protein
VVVGSAVAAATPVVRLTVHELPMRTTSVSSGKSLRNDRVAAVGQMNLFVFAVLRVVAGEKPTDPAGDFHQHVLIPTVQRTLSGKSEIHSGVVDRLQLRDHFAVDRQRATIDFAPTVTPPPCADGSPITTRWR